MTPEKPALIQLTERGHKVVNYALAMALVVVLVILALVTAPKSSAHEVPSSGPSAYDKSHHVPAQPWEKPCKPGHHGKPTPTPKPSKDHTWTPTHSPTSATVSPTSPAAPSKPCKTTGRPSPSTSPVTPSSGSPSSSAPSSSSPATSPVTSPSTSVDTSPSSPPMSSTSATSPTPSGVTSTGSTSSAPTLSAPTIPAVEQIGPPLTITQSSSAATPTTDAAPLPNQTGAATAGGTLASTGPRFAVLVLLGIVAACIAIGAPFTFFFRPSKRRTR